MSPTPEQRALYRLRLHPGEPITPLRVESEIVEILAAIETGQRFLAEKLDEAAAAKVAHEVGYARAIVDAAPDGGTKDVREAVALVRTEQTFARMVTSEAIVRAVREELHNLRATLEGFRSLGASVRQSYDNAGRHG